MNTHPYWRAFMAASVVPTLFTLVVLAGFIVARFVFQIPVALERVIVFPMALVPNLFGAWNMFYLWLGPQRHLPLGFHGALLPFILAPAGYSLATCLGFLTLGHEGLVWFHAIAVPYPLFATGFLFALVAYYLVWKHFVGFFNQVLGIA
jgi:hypothetical protein